MSKFRFVESKQDIQNFIDKFGQENYDNFLKAKDRLKNNGLSADLTWYVKHMSREEFEQAILSLYDKDTDKQRVRQIKKETHNVRGKYKFFGEIDGYLVYQPLDYISSMDLGINTGWCTTGRYKHGGHPEFTPSAKDAQEHFNNYTSQGATFYYFLNPDTFYGEYALTMFNKTFGPLPRKRDFLDRENWQFVNKSNMELYDANDNNVWYNEKIFDIAKKIGVNIDIEYVPVSSRQKDILQNGYVWKDDGTPIPDVVTKVIFPDGIKEIPDGALQWKDHVEEVVIPNGVTRIGNLAFSDCQALVDITIPDSVTSIGDKAFFECVGLTSITISDSVKSIGAMAFNRCHKLIITTNSTYVRDYCKDRFIRCNYTGENESMQYTESILVESKQDIQTFIDKFGENAYNRFRAQQTNISNKYGNQCTDLTWCIKHLDKEEMEYLLAHTRTSKDEYQTELKEICANPQSNNVTKIFDKGGYEIYHIKSPEASVKYGLVVGGEAKWCISGGYYHRSGQLLAEAQKFFRQYLSTDYDGYYFCFTPNGEKYAICARHAGGSDVWNRGDDQCHEVPGLAGVAGEPIKAENGKVIYGGEASKIELGEEEIEYFVSAFNSTKLYGAPKSKRISSDDVRIEMDGDTPTIVIDNPQKGYTPEEYTYWVYDDDEFDSVVIDNIEGGLEIDMMWNGRRLTDDGEEYIKPQFVESQYHELFNKFTRGQSYQELIELAEDLSESGDEPETYTEKPNTPSNRDALITFIDEVICDHYWHSGKETLNQFYWIRDTFGTEWMEQHLDWGNLFDWHQCAVAEADYDYYSDDYDIIDFHSSNGDYVAWKELDQSLTLS